MDGVMKMVAVYQDLQLGLLHSKMEVPLRQTWPMKKSDSPAKANISASNFVTPSPVFAGNFSCSCWSFVGGFHHQPDNFLCNMGCTCSRYSCSRVFWLGFSLCLLKYVRSILAAGVSWPFFCCFVISRQPGSWAIFSLSISQENLRWILIIILMDIIIDINGLYKVDILNYWFC